jgi:8-oxo-dGTP pyrophosphatase MutT (NUDIX family)
MAAQVELLWWDGCPSSEEAHTLVRRAMEEAGLDPEALRSLEIATDEAAAREGFPGSPTIRVDGRDIQPPPDSELPGLTCRVYHLRDGRVSALPDPEDIKEALSA